MQAPEDVAVMQRLRALGWGFKRIARELGVSKNTVRRHLRAGRWTPYRQPVRDRRLAGLEGWLKERFYQHQGNAEVVLPESWSGCTVSWSRGARWSARSPVGAKNCAPRRSPRYASRRRRATNFRSILAWRG